MMIAFPTAGTDLSDPLDARFGRAARFLLVDTETGAVRAVENAENAEAPQGAGIQAAQTILGSGAKILVSAHVGPKAFRVLQAAGARVFQADPAPLSGLLEAWRRGELPEMSAPDRTGHPE